MIKRVELEFELAILLDIIVGLWLNLLTAVYHFMGLHGLKKINTQSNWSITYIILSVLCEDIGSVGIRTRRLPIQSR